MRQILNWRIVCKVTLPLVMLMAWSGCNKSGGSGSAKPATIEVITNATEVAAARKDWEAQQEKRLKALLAEPNNIRQFNKGDVKLVRAQRERSVSALTQLRDAPATSAKLRIQASRALKLLDVATSAEQLVRWAKSDPEAAKELIAELRSFDGWIADKQPVPDEFAAFVVDCLGSSDARLRSSAAHLAAWRGVHAAREPLTKLVSEPGKPDLSLLKAAAKLCPSPEILRKLESELKGDDVLSSDGVLGSIAYLLEATSDAALKEAAAAVCVRYLKQVKDVRFIDGDTLGAVHAIANSLPAEKAKAALTDLVRAGKWKNMRESALQDLKELDAAAALALAKETKLRLYDADAAEKNKPKRTASELAAICVRHGLLTQAEADAGLKVLAEAAKDETRSAFHPVSAESLLEAAGRGMVFDVETDAFPNRHDLLIEDFANVSAGLFKPEAALERHEEPKVKGGEGKYRVQFIMGERLYRFTAQDLGDWYDLEAVVPAMHRALEHAGGAERFIMLGAGGQIASFVFAKPAALLAAAPELGLDPGKELDEARRLGKEYEERVLQDLRK